MNTDDASASKRRGFGARAVLEAPLVLLALAFGAVSVTYPFGHDQGLYAYVGREWVQRGAIPYRDVFDHKTPGIYVVHALSIALFGDHEWGVRVLELLGVVALGVASALAVTPRASTVRVGLPGLGAVAVSVFYFGHFDYWSSAQSEIWYALLGIASVAAVRRIARSEHAALAAGVLGGAAIVMKPPALTLVAIAAVLVVLRAREEIPGWRRRAVMGLVRFGGGLGLVVVLTLGYFAAHHALGAMVDIVVGANSYYVKHQQGLTTVRESVLEFHTRFGPLSSLTLLALGANLYLGVRARDRSRLSRCGLAVATVAAGFVAVAMQQKFYWLHWGVMVGPLAVLTLTMADDALGAPTSPWRSVARAAVAAIALVFVYTSTLSRTRWVDAHETAYLYLTGKMPREEYTRHFAIPSFGYAYHDLDLVGRYLREHSAPEDPVCVRGFNPEIYLLAQRRYGGRFFWTNFLVEPGRAYRREAYLAEDREAFDRIRPRFVVTVSTVHEGLESTEHYLPLGYKVAATFDTLHVLERSSSERSRLD